MMTAIASAVIVALSPSTAQSMDDYGPEIYWMPGQPQVAMDFEGHKTKGTMTYRGNKILGNRYKATRESEIVMPADGHFLFANDRFGNTGGILEVFDHGNGYLSFIYHLESRKEFENGLM